MGNPNSSSTPPILLTIAGFDPSCGAGIAADLKTFAAHNCYGVAAITALTVQSTQGVISVHATPAATLRAQIETLTEDVALAGVKIGMLANRGNASVVTEFLDKNKFAHVVLDPVFRPTAGNAELLDTSGLKFVKDELLKRVSVITPNIPEAEFLTGIEVKDVASMKAAGLKLIEMGARAVVVSGTGNPAAQVDGYTTAGALYGMILCPADGADTFRKFNGSPGRLDRSQFAVYQDNMQSYSTTEPGIDLTSTSFLMWSWRMAKHPAF